MHYRNHFAALLVDKVEKKAVIVDSYLSLYQDVRTAVARAFLAAAELQHCVLDLQMNTRQQPSTSNDCGLHAAHNIMHQAARWLGAARANDDSAIADKFAQLPHLLDAIDTPLSRRAALEQWCTQLRVNSFPDCDDIVRSGYSGTSALMNQAMLRRGVEPPPPVVRAAPPNDVFGDET
jgi:Ulp1 family protease